ncbi:ATP-binding protein, partial [Streptomyces sp. GC420]|uniref:ATP-binding protein n=1 Tax=Streptomyces sp. GC420 TaxID=2697568 RepID=UPI001414E1E0
MMPRQPLRERDAVMELVAAEAEHAREGSGSLVLLRGATGTGRTALLEAVTDPEEARGMRVLRARCSPGDHDSPFATAVRLLDSAGEFGGMTDGFETRASVTVGSVTRGFGTPAAPHDRRYAARLWSVLRSYAAEGPLLLAVDDVHLADEPSRRWLAEAARLADRLPVLLVVTERSQYDIDPPAPGLTHALPPSRVRTHTLAPLPGAAAAELVRAAAGTRTPPGCAGDCVSAAAGSPLLLHALLD